MSMNAIHCYAVFSPSYDRAMQKIHQLIKDREKYLIRILRTSNRIEYLLENERWIWINPALNPRGYRVHKAYIDRECFIEQMETCIKCMCQGYCEEEEYF